MIEVYTDGACKGNPGRGGWGIAWFHNGELFDEQYGGVEHTTNNRMELYAVIKSLELLKFWKVDRVQVVICTDSAYVFKGVTVWRHAWKRQQWRISPKKQVANMDLWQELDQYWSSNIEMRWVKGHSGCYKNDTADQLANRGCQENQNDFKS